ncbi:MAG: MauE/DoxX family redox-associated membrane protein [Desulfobacteraceae bacterium]
MNSQIKRICSNRFIAPSIRLFLGLTFIYASYHKIMAPSEFAKAVYGYGLFPSMSINLIAIIIPFVELFCGVALVTGFWTRSAALIINGLLLLFILFISINLIRGYEFDCGCFVPGDHYSAQDPWQTLLRDIILLSMGCYLYLHKSNNLGYLKE